MDDFAFEELGALYESRRRDVLLELINSFELGFVGDAELYLNLDQSLGVLCNLF